MVNSLFISVLLFLHPVHVTMTSLDFVPERGCFDAFVRLYYDDFLSDSSLQGTNLSGIDFSGGSAQARQAMESYVNIKLVIRVNGKVISGKVKEMSLDNNEISLNLEYTGGKRPETVTVRNLIMTDLYADQSNMVIIRINDFEQGIRMTPELTEKTFKIK